MIAVELRVREPPLVPSAALALHDATSALLARLMELDEARLSRLLIVRGVDFLLIQGSAADLPWAEGLIYLGKDEAAPQLLLPTSHAPNVPSTLFERALARHCKSGSPALLGPWAVSLEPPLVISLAEARPLSLQSVRRLLEQALPSDRP